MADPSAEEPTTSASKENTNPKVAIVTGANKGIGYGIVKALLSHPYDGIVYLTARDQARGLAAVEKLEKEHGLSAKFHQLNIDDQQSIETFRDFIQNEHGGLDVLVNNASIAFNINAEESLAEKAEASIRVNFFGTLNLCRELFPLLRRGARVVNMSSSLGLLPKISGAEPHSLKLRETLASESLTEAELSQLMHDFVKHAAAGTHHEAGWPDSTYAVSKVGVSALTKIQQRELDRTRPGEDLIVNCVHPGYVATDMNNYNGELTIEQGAETPTWLALLPSTCCSGAAECSVSDDGICEKCALNTTPIPRGAFVWRNKEIVDWVSGNTPTPY